MKCVDGGEKVEGFDRKIEPPRRLRLTDLFQFQTGGIRNDGLAAAWENSFLELQKRVQVIRISNISDYADFSIDMGSKRKSRKPEGGSGNHELPDLTKLERQILTERDFLINTIGKTKVIKMNDVIRKYRGVIFLASHHFIVARPNRLLDMEPDYLYRVLIEVIRRLNKEREEDKRVQSKITFSDLGKHVLNVVIESRQQKKLADRFESARLKIWEAQKEMEKIEKRFSEQLFAPEKENTNNKLQEYGT